MKIKLLALALALSVSSIHAEQLTLEGIKKQLEANKKQLAKLEKERFEMESNPLRLNLVALGRIAGVKYLCGMHDHEKATRKMFKHLPDYYYHAYYYTAIDIVKHKHKKQFNCNKVAPYPLAKYVQNVVNKIDDDRSVFLK